MASLTIKDNIVQEATENRVGFLPSQDTLIDFFKFAKVARYEEGAQGVYFVESFYENKPLYVVIKIPEKPCQEYFGTELVAALGIHTPAMRVIHAHQEKKLSDQILKTIEKTSIYKRRFIQEKPSVFCLMSYVPGVTLQDLSRSDLDKTAQQRPIAFYDGALFEIGEIAAIDFLLYNQDRLPTIGMGNLSNLMLLSDSQGFYIGAAALDQVAYLSEKRTNLFEEHMPSSFERIQSLVAEIVKSPDEICQTARVIYEDEIPEEVKPLLQEDRALKAIHRGILAGLHKIHSCTQEQLIKIYERLPSSTNRQDIVDLKAYKKMLDTIQKLL